MLEEVPGSCLIDLWLEAEITSLGGAAQDLKLMAA